MNNTKIINKIIALTICIMLVFSVTLVPASAETVKSGKIEIYNSITSDYGELYQTLRDGIENFETSINIYKYNASTEDIQDIMRYLYYTNPDLFFVNTAACSYTRIGSTLYEFRPVYTCDSDTAKQRQTQLDKVINEILSKIKPDMTDLEKTIIVHDEIVSRCVYNSTKTEQFCRATIYDCLVNGEALCEGYTRTFTYLLSMLGISSEIITSEAMNHAWCKIKLDGEYYNVDVTWDDPVNGTPGYADHDFFLHSDASFAELRHYDYSYIHPANSTKYDSWLIHEINTRLCYVDGEFYAIDNTYESDYERCIIKYEPNTDKAEIEQQLPYRWWSSNISYWVNGFSSLDEKDGLLYYNSPDSVYSYDVATKATELVVENEYENDIYGMYIKGNDIYGYLTANPNEEGESVLLATLKSNKLIGDVNADATLTISDATLLQRYLAEIVEFSDEQLSVADTNGDGGVNINDVTKIQYTIAGY